MWRLHGMGEWKFIQMVQVTWPVWPPCPYMVKTFKKSSSLEPNSRWPWKLVCSIGYSSTMKFVQMMTLGWPWPILLKRSNLVPYAFVWEKGNIMDFSETIVSMISKLVEPFNYMSTWTFMNIKGQGHSLTFFQGHSDSTFSNFFCSETARPIEAKFHMEPPWDVRNENLFKCSRSHDHAHIWWKT